MSNSPRFSAARCLAFAVCAFPAASAPLLAGCQSIPAVLEGTTTLLSLITAARASVDEGERLVRRLFSMRPELEKTDEGQRVLRAITGARTSLEYSARAIDDARDGGKKGDPVEVFAAFRSAWDELRQATLALHTISAKSGPAGVAVFPLELETPRAAR